MGLMLFAANEGYLNDVEVKKIGDFERALQSPSWAPHADQRTAS
jgi:F-type H+-transporting ATPase subunit alpha